MSIVLVHEWIAKWGGAENVLGEFLKIFPKADITCLWNDAPDRYPNNIVHETWLAQTPLRKNKMIALPFMLPTWRNLGSSEAEKILCSSHLFAHHAKFKGPASEAKKYVYAHTPARYIWTPELDGRGDNVFLKPFAASLKVIDKKRSKEAYSIAANSKFIQERIANTWGIESEVIYPPVATDKFSSATQLNAVDEKIFYQLPKEFALAASRFVSYKGLDMAMKLASKANIPMIVAGNGPELAYLQELAAELKGEITILKSPSAELLKALYKTASVYIFPPVEDFGIMPVEAMSAGTAVIANALGGASETVLEGKTGYLIEDFSSASAVDALHKAMELNSSDCIARAKEFDTSVFQRKIKTWISS